MSLDLEFSDEQEMLREMVRGLCADHSPLTEVRRLEDDPTGYAPDFWKQLAGLDLIGLMLPAEHGGSGMSMVEGCVLYEELGRSLAPTPHFVSAVMAGGILAAAGTDEQRSTWLPRVASGDAVLTIAWLEPENGFGPKGVQVRATADGDGFVLSGTKRHVAFAGAAERLVVLARTGDAETDVDLFLVDPTASGVTLEQQFTIASSCQYELRLDGVRVAEADRVGGAGSGWGTFSSVLNDGLVLLAAQAVGGAHYALEITTQYAKDRVQFDKPLGAFQAISHYLADAKTNIDGATLLTHEAAWAAATGRDTATLAPMAKLFACQTYRDATAMAQQVFGGVGFTLEYDIQLYFRRAKELQISWCDTRRLEELVAAQVLD